MLALILHRVIPFHCPGECMIIATLTIKVPPGKRKAALDILQSIQGPLWVRQELLARKIYENSEQSEILILEYWGSKEALHRHIKSDLFTRVLEAMELASITPELSFLEVSNVQGMELVVSL